MGKKYQDADDFGVADRNIWDLELFKSKDDIIDYFPGGNKDVVGEYDYYGLYPTLFRSECAGYVCSGESIEYSSLRLMECYPMTGYGIACYNKV